MQGFRTTATACAVIAGIEAVQMIRKGQVLGITRKNLHGQAWVFGTLLGVNYRPAGTATPTSAFLKALLQHFRQKCSFAQETVPSKLRVLLVRLTRAYIQGKRRSTARR